MAEALLTVEVDQAAGTAYLRLSDRAVARTEEFNDWILVDLDEFNMVVGLEFLSTTDDIPLEDLVSRYHIRREAVDLLLAVETSVANRTNIDAAGQFSGSSASFGAVLSGRSSGAWRVHTST
jgi:uncharacterized protein YuzE